MYHGDIEGTRAKSFYKGVAREVLNMRDIDGNSPKYESVRFKVTIYYFKAETKEL